MAGNIVQHAGTVIQDVNHMPDAVQQPAVKLQQSLNAVQASLANPAAEVAMTRQDLQQMEERLGELIHRAVENSWRRSVNLSVSGDRPILWLGNANNALPPPNLAGGALPTTKEDLLLASAPMVDALLSHYGIQEQQQGLPVRERLRALMQFIGMQYI